MTGVFGVKSHALEACVRPDDSACTIGTAVTGQVMARAGTGPLDNEAVLHHAGTVGGLALRRMTFHDRVRMLKPLATHPGTQKAALCQLSYATGAK